MKKILFYVSLACVLATFSCSDNEEAPLPGTPGAITGANANDCPAITVDLSIGAVTGATSYQWFKDGTVLKGATVATYTVRQSGTYTVAGVNANGTGPRSAAHAVIITECDDEPLPGDAGAITGANDNDCPDVTVDLSIAEIEGAVSYQWYKNETVITGATLITYTVTQSGTYTVAGVNASGTGTPSPDHVVTITSCGDEPDPDGIFEDVESHTNWTINSPGTIGWTYFNDPDAGVYGIMDITYPYANDPKAYQVFNPSQTIPALSYPGHSGDKFFASFARTDGAMNDTWIVSPVLDFEEEFTISFIARSLNDSYGLESFNVVYSTTGNNKADFTNLATPTPIETTTDWEEYSYTIPANATHVAIQCVSEDVFGFFVDDIFIGMDTPARSASAITAKNKIVNDWAKHAVKTKK